MKTKIDEMILEAEVGFSETVIMICSHCGKQFNDERSEAPAKIKSELKAKCKTHYGKKVRVINTSCLNMCPENKIAIVMASIRNEDIFKGYSVPVDVKIDELFKLIKVNVNQS